MHSVKNYMSATANVKGSSLHPELYGKVMFHQMKRGVLVTAEINGLPFTDETPSGFYAFHIHDGQSCTGNETDPFAAAGTHYNPRESAHPYHAGDLPPLLGNRGYAYMSVLTDRFTLDEIMGRVIIVHQNPDDFVTQPAGNSGMKIACGKIVPDWE